ncbi:Cilia- and flagella-associated protein 52 [Trichoplax sp. H2]|uniref:Cilia- and flagella-associated protein 52 n=1 Tax=Trichoplax adhaerens TaxID=10228 RepID=B3RQ27_TRIAD|nr:hypothetical protein TRIADDRAFT_53754 [Trichoplax adhaerens]EDV27747.1 hypothetical protein TRIADDRAFT_53754 [Trichoplax adhaerens]RDD39432.1 Cilia- and flagella-associated protein 52 [Trichoplax sp. H2]|eukprot:XP_002109581.1 hypothetical protein TRIADDRAFT_53754 [Trichoplax adhaerens]
MEESGGQTRQLQLASTIGFSGDIHKGLLVHPDRQHLVHAIGSTIVIQDLADGSQKFLVGHTGDVSCLTVSRSGRYIASGQVAPMGFKAEIIIWDFEKRTLKCRLTLHKVRVYALAFSPNDKFLVSLGGQDDGSVVVWDVASEQAICGSPAALQSAGVTYAIAYANNNDYKFVTGGNQTLRIWELDLPNRKIRPTDCGLGQLKRVVKCIEINEDDSVFYCGTTTGDILQVNMNTHLMKDYGPQKERLSLGILSLSLLTTGDILAGAGDGTVALISGAAFAKKKNYIKNSVKVQGPVTSISLRGQGHQFFVGTERSEIYRFNLADFSNELITTCHYSAINDINFPFGYSDVFATCSKNDIRVWNANNNRLLLRITVPNIVCETIDFTRDGKTIISGWNDGKIRAFTPESGKEIYTLHDAHNKGVTAIASTSDCQRIISGGGEGQVRVWQISAKKQTLLEAMKEHKGSVSCIKIRKNDQECVTASTDGTCIIWDLQRFVRNQIIFANTLFKGVCYRPDECQIITCGTDRKIGYWETYDGTQIRELEGSKSSINGMDIAPDGLFVVTGGADKVIRMWKYNDGEVEYVGYGHSSDISRLRICPNQKHIVSVSVDGAVMRWKYPSTFA